MMSKSRASEQKEKIESKQPPKRKISWSTPMEELINAYLFEGDLVAARNIEWLRSYDSEGCPDSKKASDDYQTLLNWLEKLKNESKSWSEEFKEEKSLKDQVQLRKQTLLWLLSTRHYDLEEQNKWILASANQREPVAQSLLGRCHFSNDDDTRAITNFFIVPDITRQQALSFIEQSAKQGYSMAQAVYGRRYYLSPVGGEKKAEYWSALAAQQDDPMGQYCLAQIKENQGKMGEAALLYRRSHMLRCRYVIGLLDKLFRNNQNNLHVVFNTAVAFAIRNPLLFNILSPCPIKQLNILLRQLIERIEAEEGQEAKEMSAAMKEFNALFEMAEDMPHKIINQILTDKKVKERWGQYVVKHVDLQKRFAQVTQVTEEGRRGKMPMPTLASHIFSFVGNMNLEAKGKLQATAAKHYVPVTLTQNLINVLKGQEGAEKALYECYVTECKNICAAESKGLVIKDYSELEKQIEAKAKVIGTSSGNLIARGLLYYAGGHYSKAETEFQKAMQAKDPRGYTCLAELYSVHRSYFQVTEDLADQILQERDEVVRAAAARAKPGS